VLDGAELPVAYHVLYRSDTPGWGEVLPFGGGAPLEPGCDEPDFNSLLPLDGGRAALVTHFECVPGSTWVSALDQAADGALTVTSAAPVNWDALGGVWFPCSGQASPWGTHLGSEEYEPDARGHQADGTLSVDPYGAWTGLLTLYAADPTAANPYRYGWATEIGVDRATAASTPHKRYALGRFSHELSFVLPDQRTVYQSDDGSAVGWFLFVADAAGDLTSGALYAARFGPGAAVGWVPLGRATEAEVDGWIALRPRFSELFDAVTPDAAHTCPADYRYVHTSNGRECLKLAAPSDRFPEPGRVASRLETRRYAAWLGASTELEKAEGVTYDPATGRVYLAVSTVAGRAVAEPGEPVDHLALPPNRCGVVLGFDTAARLLDTEGHEIPSDHVGAGFTEVLAGTPAGESACDDAGIANPDNLTFLPDYQLLMVAEDTKRHEHAFLWAYDVRTGVGARIAAAPPHGEVTGIHWIPHLGGFGYLTLTFQHPWAELAPGQVTPPWVTPDDQRAFTGFLGPFPLR
ncbi:MAG: alkaline phosphatase PhoX, partial [Myxococcota bacterium]